MIVTRISHGQVTELYGATDMIAFFILRAIPVREDMAGGIEDLGADGAGGRGGAVGSGVGGVGAFIAAVALAGRTDPSFVIAIAGVVAG